MIVKLFGRAGSIHICHTTIIIPEILVREVKKFQVEIQHDV